MGHQPLSVFSSLETTSGPTFDLRKSRITGTNFLAWSVVRPSLLKPPTMVAMSPALPPMAPASPPSMPPSPPPGAGAFFMRSPSPGTPPSSLSNSAPPSLSLAALNSTAAPPSACWPLTPRFLVSMSMSSFMGYLLVVGSVVSGRGKAVGTLAPGRPDQRHLAHGDVGLARGHIDGAQRDGAGVQRGLEPRHFGCHLALRVRQPLLQHFDVLLGARHVLGFLAPA